MGSSVLAIFAVDARAGEPVEVVPIAIFATVSATAVVLVVRGVRASRGGRRRE